MLEESVVYLQPVYLVSWGAIGIVLGLIACVVLVSKGYTGEGVAALILGLVCFPLGLIAVIVALTRADKRLMAQVAPLPAKRPPPVITRERRQRMAAEEAERMAAVPKFVQCLRCGETNNADLTSCWKCAQSFLPLPQTVMPTPPAADELAPIFGTPAAPGMPDPDATPVLGSPEPLGFEAREIKVRCKTCRKKFAGTVAQIARMRACPRCKASPFEPVSVEADS